MKGYPTDQPTTPSATSLPLAVRAVHLAALSSIALGEPLLRTLGNGPAFFVARGSSTAEILLVAIAVTLGPAILLLAAEATAQALAPRASRALHVIFVALLAGVVAFRALGDLPGPLVVACGIAMGAGTGFALLYVRAGVVRSFTTMLGAAPVIVLVWFLALSPTAPLVLPDAESAAHGTGRDTPVVMIVFDELPISTLMTGDDTLDRVRFPAFARMADRATWYRNATTIAEGTNEALPALLTGRMPRFGRPPSAEAYRDSVFTRLAGSHELVVTESFTHLCPTALCGDRRSRDKGGIRSLASDIGIVGMHAALPRSATGWLPTIARNWGNFGDSSEADRASDHAQHDGIAAFNDFLQRIRPSRGARAPFHFVHTSLPHAPWTILPTGQHYPWLDSEIPGVNGQEEWTGHPILVRQAFEQHVLQVQFADRLLGRALRRLEATGLYNRALVIVASDHGAAFKAGAHRRRTAEDTVSQIAGIPLIVKYPGQQRGRIDDGPARITDIVPTIAATLNADGDRRFDGRSLRDMPRRRPTADVYAASGDVISAPLSDMVTARRRTIRKWKGLLRTDGPKSHRGLAAGPRPDLLGRHVTDLGVAGGKHCRELLEPAAAWSAVDPGGAVVPVLAAGSGPAALAGKPVLFSVNGRIVAGTTAYPGHAREARFSAVLPWTALRRGANEVVALTPGPNLTFIAVACSDTPAPYRVDAAMRRVITPSGRSIVLRSDGAKGYIDNASRRGPVVRLSGWAARSDLSAPATIVLAVAAGEVVGVQVPSVLRKDLAAGYGRPELRRSGYALTIPFAALDCATPSQGLSVIAITRGTAGLLTRTGDVDPTLARACSE